MSNEEEEEVEFPITGNFNIPIIYPVNIENQDLDINENLELPQYQDGVGNALNPSKGYYIHQDLEPTEFINKHTELKEIFDNFTLIDFIVDNYGNTSRYIEGKIIKEQRRLGVRINNIFWVQPDLLIIRGSKKTAKIFKASFENIFRRDILLGAPYQFDPWFFVWLIFKYRNKTPEVDDDFFLELMLDMSVEGLVEDLTGQYALAKKSIDVSRSLIILIPLLEKKFPSDVKLGINVNNLTAVIKINKTGRIIIYQSRGISKELNRLERTIVGCLIIRRIINLYQKWKDLSTIEKIPPPEFIDNISQELINKGVEITSNVADTKSMYIEKRNL